MGYYDHKENIAEYIAMSEGYDGAQLISVLRKWLPPGATVLELGMGAGGDLALLGAHYRVCGSDHSPLFVEHCQAHLAHYPPDDLLLLDARTIETERRFDGIYSNKVLHYLHEEELHQSFARQRQVTHRGGVVMHSFWYGQGEGEVSERMGYYRYYTEDNLRMIAEKHFRVLAIERYKEMESEDSLYLVGCNDRAES